MNYDLPPVILKFNCRLNEKDEKNFSWFPVSMILWFGFKSLAVSNRQPLNEIRIKISAISIAVNIVYLKTFEKKKLKLFPI